MNGLFLTVTTNLSSVKIFGGILLALCCLSAGARAQSVSRAECFAFETLPVDERKRAEELLLKALDSEALYTIVGNIKPMSSGFQNFQIQVQLPRIEFAEAEKVPKALVGKKAEDLTADEKRRLNQAKQAAERRQTLDKINETRRIFERWRCGDEIFADVYHFDRVFDGKRFLEAVVFSRPRLRRMLGEKSDFFSRWGITTDSHPLEILYAVDRDETGARFGGYGYLFGYPDYAVQFFVEAAGREEFTGKFVERDFLSIPTVASEKNGFVYAVPKNYAEQEVDKDLRARAERIYTSYKKRRAEYIGEGKKGASEMLRDWFCDSKNMCSPSGAKID